MPGRSETIAYFYNNRLYRIEVFLFDVSETAANNFRGVLAEKYGSIGGIQANHDNSWAFVKPTPKGHITSEWRNRELYVSFLDQVHIDQMNKRRAMEEAEKQKQRQAEREALLKPGKNDTVDFGKSI